MKGRKRMNGHILAGGVLAAVAAVILGMAMGMTVKAKAEGRRDGCESVTRLVYLGEDPSGEFVARELVDPAGIKRVMDRFDVCPMGEASIGNEAVIRTVLESDFAVQIWMRGVEEPMVMYFSFTDEVVVLAPDGWCAISEMPMMDTEAVRNEFWREEGGWNAGTVD